MKNESNNKGTAKSLKNRKIIGVSLLLLTISVYIFIGARMSWIMVSGEIDGENLEQNVHELYTAGNTLQANRGTIYDRNENPIAVDATSYKAIAVLTDQWSNENNPIHIQEPQEVAEVISDHLAVSYETALRKLTSEAAQIEFGSAGADLSYNTVKELQKELEKKELTGINFEESQTRLYPNGTFASHIVGLAQNDTEVDEESSSQLTGVMGIEAQFDELLTGQNGSVVYQKDRFGYALPNGETDVADQENGDNLYLTLDRRLQIHLENIMTEVEEEHSPRAMTATVMDAKTGEILASAQRPSFNATTKEGINNSWQNLLVEYEIEPGSTLKVLTLAAAIEEGVFDPDEEFLSGRYRTAGGVIHDVNPEGWGYITNLEGLFRSSNIAFVRLVEKMGYDTWKGYLDAYGFGQKTGISLPNEYSGRNPYKEPLQKLNTSFGQGITATPVQMLQAFSALTNDGHMVQPRIISKAADPEAGESKETGTIEKESPISEESAKQALEYLSAGVKSEYGTARGYAVEGYNVAAKTGTSQLINPETGSYYQSAPDFNYSVVGMLPAEDPELIVYITVQQPTLTSDASYGGAVVQKIYHPLMNRATDYLDSENTAEQPASQEDLDYGETPDFTEMSIEESAGTVEEMGLDVGVIGNGENIVQQSPKPNTPIYDAQRIILMTNGAMSLPDMTGWSRNDVLRAGELAGITFNFEGSGYVVSQEMEPGSFVESGSEILIELDALNGEETNSERSETQIEESFQEPGVDGEGSENESGLNQQEESFTEQSEQESDGATIPEYSQ